jgi:hypothetical protein
MAKADIPDRWYRDCNCDSINREAQKNWHVFLTGNDFFS